MPLRDIMQLATGGPPPLMLETNEGEAEATRDSRVRNSFGGPFVSVH